MQQEEVRVFLTCFDHTRRTQCQTEQFFKPGEDWEQWKKVERNRVHLQALCKSHGSKQDFEKITKDEFFRTLEEDEQRALTETFAMAVVRELDTYVPLHFWLVDDMSAVFAIPSSSAVEYGFSTTDQKLISAFVDLRRRYHQISNTSVTPTSDRPAPKRNL